MIHRFLITAAMVSILGLQGCNPPSLAYLIARARVRLLGQTPAPLIITVQVTPAPTKVVTLEAPVSTTPPGRR